MISKNSRYPIAGTCNCKLDCAATHALILGLAKLHPFFIFQSWTWLEFSFHPEEKLHSAKGPRRKDEKTLESEQLSKQITIEYHTHPSLVMIYISCFRYFENYFF